jgi:hypothetical protein
MAHDRPVMNANAVTLILYATTTTAAVTGPATGPATAARVHA